MLINKDDFSIRKSVFLF